MVPVVHEQAKLTAGDERAGDQFGTTVGLSGDTAVVGAFLDDHAGGMWAGSAYVFVRGGTTWSRQLAIWSRRKSGARFFVGDDVRLWIVVWQELGVGRQPYVSAILQCVPERSPHTGTARAVDKGACPAAVRMEAGP